MKATLRTMHKMRQMLEMGEQPGDCVVLMNSLNHHPIPMKYVEPVNLPDRRVMCRAKALLDAHDYKHLVDHLKQRLPAIIVAGCFMDEKHGV